MRSAPPAFTLVELLVVVTVIVVLMALLAPAMDRAIYHAELVVCGSSLKAVGAGATQYAMDHKKRYPYRPPAAEDMAGVESPRRPQVLRLSAEMASIGAHDERPILKPYISINGMLNCAASQKADLENTDPDSTVHCSYGLWFGWYFFFENVKHRPMARLGDGLAWEENGTSYNFQVLAADVMVLNNNNVQASSHPARNDAPMHYTFYQDEYGDASTVEGANVPGVDAKYTLSHWGGGPARNIRLDRNFAYTDGSVQRMNDIRPDLDSRLAPVPDRRNGAKYLPGGGGLRTYLPPR